MSSRGRKRFVAVETTSLPVDTNLLAEVIGDDPVESPFGTSRDDIGSKRRNARSVHAGISPAPSGGSAALKHVSDDEPISLREASKLLRGLVGERALRAAAESGELVAERLGGRKRWVTTQRHIREWRERCRVSAQDQNSTKRNPLLPVRRSSTSATDRGERLQASAMTALRKLARRPARRSKAI